MKRAGAWVAIIVMLATQAACVSEEDPAQTQDGGEEPARTHDTAAIGPLQVPPAHGWAISAVAGEPFTDGYELLRLGGDQPATITRVRITGEAGLTLTGSLVAVHPPTQGITQYFPDFPPADDAGALTELVGATIEPAGDGEGVREIYLGIEAKAPGTYTRRTIELDYEVGGEDFRVALPAELTVCAVAKGEPRPKCRLPR